MRTRFYSAKHSLDDSPGWWAWTTGERWNGWGTPYFERDELEVMLDWLKKEGWAKDWWWDGQKVCVSDDDPEPECYPMETIDTPRGRLHVWPVGAWAWTWSVDQDDEERAVEQAQVLSRQWGDQRRDDVDDLKRRLT